MCIRDRPLCYAKGLVLENCEMIDCDLSFEKSEVTTCLLYTSSMITARFESLDECLEFIDTYLKKC